MVNPAFDVILEKILNSPDSDSCAAWLRELKNMLTGQKDQEAVLKELVRRLERYSISKEEQGRPYVILQEMGSMRFILYRLLYALPEIWEDHEAVGERIEKAIKILKDNPALRVDWGISAERLKKVLDDVNHRFHYFEMLYGDETQSFVILPYAQHRDALLMIDSPKGTEADMHLVVGSDDSPTGELKVYYMLCSEILRILADGKQMVAKCVVEEARKHYIYIPDDKGIPLFDSYKQQLAHAMWEEVGNGKVSSGKEQGKERLTPYVNLVESLLCMCKEKREERSCTKEVSHP